MITWKMRTVALKFAISDLSLGAWRLPLCTHEVSLAEGLHPVASLQAPVDDLDAASAGYLLRGVPVATEQARLSATSAYICYVQRQYRHFYVDMRLTFDEYKAKFSSKTRSTISRKIKKFTEHCGGTMRWHTYSSPTEMAEFHRLARGVSALTYQERLLDAGLPEGSSFVEEMVELAGQDRVRAWVLFDGERPVSYLYCPVQDDVLIYAYLGYDPAYLKLSVGTVLQWLAFEQLFGERRFRYFDFTEGESDHKRLFATHDVLAVNVLFLRRSVKHWLLVRLHSGFSRCVESFGEFLDANDLRVRIRRLIRFGSRGASLPDR